MANNVKHVTTPSGTTCGMVPVGMDGCACAGCGTVFRKTDYMGVCSDCGGMFCETCVQNGTFEDHTCEEGDLDD